MHKCQNMKLGKYDSLPIHVLQQFVEGVLNVHCVIFIWLLTFIRVKFVQSLVSSKYTAVVFRRYLNLWGEF